MIDQTKLHVFPSNKKTLQTKKQKQRKPIVQGKHLSISTNKYMYV